MSNTRKPKQGQTFYTVDQERDHFNILKCFITSVKNNRIYYSNPNGRYFANDLFIRNKTFSSLKKAIHYAKLNLNETKPAPIETYCLGIGTWMKCTSCLHYLNWLSINDYGNGWFEYRRDNALRIDDELCQLSNGKLFVDNNKL